MDLHWELKIFRHKINVRCDTSKHDSTDLHSVYIHKTIVYDDRITGLDQKSCSYINYIFFFLSCILRFILKASVMILKTVEIIYKNYNRINTQGMKFIIGLKLVFSFIARAVFKKGLGNTFFENPQQHRRRHNVIFYMAILNNFNMRLWLYY